MTRIAYLEISPRQTGKTERLIRFARCLCFNTTKSAKAEVQARLSGALVLAEGEKFPASENTADYVWFYDEFDWLNSVKVRHGAFYATTPRFIRKAGKHTPDNDLLMRLVQNARKVQRNFWPSDMSNLLDEARQLHSSEEFRLLYMGEFLQ